jgi:hypothetical protein
MVIKIAPSGTLQVGKRQLPARIMIASASRLEAKRPSSVVSSNRPPETVRSRVNNTSSWPDGSGSRVSAMSCRRDRAGINAERSASSPGVSSRLSRLIRGTTIPIRSLPPGFRWAGSRNGLGPSSGQSTGSPIGSPSTSIRCQRWPSSSPVSVGAPQLYPAQPPQRVPPSAGWRSKTSTPASTLRRLAAARQSTGSVLRRRRLRAW